MSIPSILLHYLEPTNTNLENPPQKAKFHSGSQKLEEKLLRWPQIC